MSAAYEVRITPLLLGIPGGLEGDPDFNVTQIDDESGTTLVPQFLDDGFEVNIAISEPLTATVVIPIDEPCVAGLEPFQQAVRICYSRPGATVPEALIYGPCNVSTDYAAGTVTLTVQDPSQRCQHHYIRRGDYALNQTNETGFIASNSDSILFLIDAARNTLEQQDRDVPALAFDAFDYGDGVPDAPFMEVERGQEVWDLCQQIMRSTTGPDVYIAPRSAWGYPFTAYMELGMYDAMTDPASPVSGELGRNLDPADPDDPQPGEVIFDFGLGLDNLVGLVVAPSHATTHCHAVDADRKYRVTAADAASSAAIGVWVDWIASDYNVVGGDTAPLQALADARVDAYGVPPKFFTCTLRPDDAQPYHYGHAFFSADTPGDFQIGDFVRVRAQRGYRSFSTLARITGAKFRLEGGLPVLDVDMVPAIAGDAGADPQGT